MSIYQFVENSPISSIQFTTSASGNTIGYVHASKNTPPEELHKIIDGLKDKQYFCTPYGLKGEPCLEIRKFGKEKALLSALKELNAVQGEPTVTPLDKETVATLDKLRKRSLQASGVFQMIGDYNFFRYGFKNKSGSDMLAGIFYALGTSSLVGYGRNDQSNRQVKDISDKLAEYLENNHINVSKKCSLKSITEDHEKGLIGSANDFLSRYPSEVYNVFTGLAGLAVAHAAYNHKFKLAPLATDLKTAKNLRHSGLLDMGLGLMTFAATTFGLLVKEKKKDPDEPPAETKIQQAWEWAQSNPLAVTGMGLMVSTGCHAVSTALDYRDAIRTNDLQAKSAIPSRAGFVGANIIAEILILISSKGHGHGVIADESVKKSIYAAAAELINAQDKDTQKAAFDSVVTFLSRPTVFAESRKQVETEIHLAIGELQKNPWACKVVKQSQPEQPSPDMYIESAQRSGNPMPLANMPDGWQHSVQSQQHLATATPNL